ncbi:hypothetical protein HPG69_008471 [Diceros bicornis minor]|uniref:Uncharacterized protein n=1 Tax=Diceros bicornis minor TaxID=77932 RepID=A0A7J7FKT4_DICBM|nr:hypothetical protein HPG69_008471 [Diceros bicornis minor]
MSTRGCTDASHFLALKYLRGTLLTHLMPHHHTAVSPKLLCKLCKGAQTSRLSRSLTRPILPLPSRNKVLRHEGSNFKERSLPPSCPLGLRRTRLKLARETRLPGTETGSGGRGRRRGSPPPEFLADPGPFHERPSPATRTPPALSPADPPRTPPRPPPTCQSRPQNPASKVPAGDRTAPHKFPQPAPWRAEGGGRSPSTSPGSGNGGVRLPGATSESLPGRRARGPPPPPATRGGRGGNEVTSGRSRRRRRRRLWEAAERESRAAEQVRRGGYRSALRPIVSLPRGSRRSRAREPGSSPARHLLPPLWKRPPPPRAARPGPRLRAAGPARLTGRRQPSPLRPRPPPSWRGPGGPFPAARARRSRVPAGRGGAPPGLRGAGAGPGMLSQKRRLCPRDPGEGGPGPDWRART